MEKVMLNLAVAGMAALKVMPEGQEKEDLKAAIVEVLWIVDP